MMKLNVFSTKSSGESPVYRDIAKSRGYSQRRISSNYRAIASEGYKETFIVFRALEEIIKGCIQLNFVVNTKDKDGKLIATPNHPVNSIFSKPNDMYSWREFVHRAVLFRYIGGEAPMQFIKTINTGALYTYRPDKVSFSASGDPVLPYRDIVYQAGYRTPIEPEEFLMWKKFDPSDDLDGMGHGMSLLAPILKSIDHLNAFKDWNTALLNNGGNPSGVFSVPEVMEEIEFNRMKTSITQETSKSSVGKYLLLDGGTTFTQMSINPKDMDWVEGGKETIKHICSGMGVDPILIGFNEYSSYNNKQEASKELYTKVAIPMMKDLASMLESYFRVQKLLQPNEYVLIEYNHIPEMQVDVEKQSTRLQAATFLSLNEKRQEMQKEAVEGGELIAGQNYVILGKEVYVPMSFVNVKDLEYKEPATETDNKDFPY